MTLFSSNFLLYFGALHHFLVHIENRSEEPTVKGNVFLFILCGALYPLWSDVK